MNERSIEYAFVFKVITDVAPKNILDVGTGRTALPALIKTCRINIAAIDSGKKQVKENKHFKVKRNDILNPTIKGCFDLILCVSVLEHIPDYNTAIKNMASLLSPNGILLLTFPFTKNAFVENVYKLKESKHKEGLCHAFTENELDKWQQNNRLRKMRYEYWEVYSGKYWSCGKRLPKPKTNNDRCHLACVCLERDND